MRLQGRELVSVRTEAIVVRGGSPTLAINFIIKDRRVRDIAIKHGAAATHDHECSITCSRQCVRPHWVWRNRQKPMVLATGHFITWDLASDPVPPSPEQVPSAFLLSLLHVSLLQTASSSAPVEARPFLAPLRHSPLASSPLPAAPPWLRPAVSSLFTTSQSDEASRTTSPSDAVPDGDVVSAAGCTGLDDAAFVSLPPSRDEPSGSEEEATKRSHDHALEACICFSTFTVQ